MRKLILRALLAAALLPLAGAALADDFVVIVNKDNGDPAGAEYVGKIYRGEAKNWPSGGAINFAVMAETSPLRAAFDKKILDKTPAQSKGLWAQMTFAGKIIPPKSFETEAEMVKYVAENPHAVGYVSPGAVGAGVKAAK
jgi:ABC-type phosphate transport system substrate-binding protein